MPCYTPISAYRANTVNPETGKRPIVFQLRQGFHDLPIQLPCGRCTGCRLERSRQWAIRAMHEAQLHTNNHFVTLTYSDEALAESGNLELKELRHEDFQKFFKRLRKKFGSGIRYYMCGEYGEKFKRPHFHAIIYGLPLTDLKFLHRKRGSRLYTSAALERLWGHGYVSIGEVTFNSAAYIARYIMKKHLGPGGAEKYERLNEFGEYVRVPPEYQQSSRRPGLARGWLDKFTNDVYPKGYFTLNGVKMRPPKYYDLQYEVAYPEEMRKIKADRRFIASGLAADSTRERLDVRWIVADEKLKTLKRNLDDES